MQQWQSGELFILQCFALRCTGALEDLSLHTEEGVDAH